MLDLNVVIISTSGKILHLSTEIPTTMHNQLQVYQTQDLK